LNNRITYQQVKQRLHENGLNYGELRWENDIRIIVSERSGRIFGPFLDDNGESISWLPPDWGNAEAFRAMLASGKWNVGGERLWIGAEVQYMVPNRNDYWGTIFVPPQMDPGTYQLTQPTPDIWQLSQRMTLDCYSVATGQKHLLLESTVRRVENPLHKLDEYPALMNGVRFAGYEQVVSLTESKHDEVMSESWNLLQLNPGGLLIIPCTPRLQFTDYYEPAGGLQTVFPTHTRVQITGNQRYKLGFKSVHVFGRMGYFNQFDVDNAYLFVRNFFNNPSSQYREEPDFTPGRQGDSMHIYNDGGMFGGFGELEMRGQTIGGATGKMSSTDTMTLWFFAGTAHAVREIAVHLLGVEL
jgi:hypothetical protein